ncbi:MAG TPA: hypothetical protein VK738_12640 [Terriglobales bacterium]|jgi:hypothetical protein|nr:hypothetical protein [Terriglobales bacterium]
MILLVTTCDRGEECAAVLQKAASEQVQVIKTTRQPQVREEKEQLQGKITVVVMDEGMLDSEPVTAQEFLDSMDTAIPVFINFAISGMERIVREVRMALHRHQREQFQAMQAAESILRGEVKDTVTGILLSSQLALETPDIPKTAQAKVQDIYQLALALRARLDPDASKLRRNKKENVAAQI